MIIWVIGSASRLTALLKHRILFSEDKYLYYSKGFRMLEKFVLEKINQYAEELETKLDGDVIYYYGPIHPSLNKVI